MTFKSTTKTMLLIKQQWRKRPLPFQLFLLMCLNLVIAPAIYASNDGVSKEQAYAIAILGIVTVFYAIYLFVVMFQPERF